MKERGGGNGSDRPRWAGDGLLEIRGPRSCWLIWSVCSFGTAQESAGAGAGAGAGAPHHLHPHSHLHLHFYFYTGHFPVSDGRRAAGQPKSLTCPGTRAHSEGQQARPGREGNVVWELTGLPLFPPQAAASIEPASSSAFSQVPWALTEVIHSLALALPSPSPCLAA